MRLKLSRVERHQVTENNVNQHNDNQHIGTQQHNETQHNNTTNTTLNINDTRHKTAGHLDEFRYAQFRYSGFTFFNCYTECHSAECCGAEFLLTNIRLRLKQLSTDKRSSLFYQEKSCITLTRGETEETIKRMKISVGGK